ncbi:MAG: hypothetical protein AUJ98_03635 [Bacteroidetes bacterium CG2_30_33_31]|nr:MAG: hypothetical protein AUJ98_03635 [Bacteroidetes bacterium CG2_30_33_31]
MIVVENVIVSEDVAFVEFNCDLKSCHGDCCVEGDEGAPLEDYEIGIIEDYLDDIKPFMVEEGIKIVEKNGTFDYGMDGEYVTPLVNDRECAFVYFENGISFCAIEKAFLQGKIDFRKPISCHLYPIRITKYKDYDAVNYHRWPVCDAALILGHKKGEPLYITLKEPLIRKYGSAWYHLLLAEIKKIIG